MRIACLQFAPQVGDIDNNLNRADSILSRVDPKDLDLLVLPELAFTGYPEKVDPTLKWPTDPEYYNAAIVVGPDGEVTANYRKSHLYYTDETWALEGQGFFAGRLPGLGKTAIGICMDINPYKFQVPWQDFEFANHVLQNNVRLVIVSMAWITQEEPSVYTQNPDEPDMDTLTYWLARLDPVIRSEPDHEIIVVFANRCGQEEGATYAGTSAVVGIKGTDVKVYGILGRGQKDLLVVDTDDLPYAKLVYRPTEKVPAEEGEPTSSRESGRPGSTECRIPERKQEEPNRGHSRSRNEDDPSPTLANGQSGSFLQYQSETTALPVPQEITVTEKPDRRSTLVEFSPIEDDRGFFDEDGSPITPTYEEQYWWPSPFTRSAHRRYHSTSSLGRVSDQTRGRHAKAPQNRSSVGSTLSDNAASRRTKKWVSTSSILNHDYGGYGSTVSPDSLSMMKAAQHGTKSPLSTEHLLDEFFKPSTKGFSALSIRDTRRFPRKNEQHQKTSSRRVPSGPHQGIRDVPARPHPEPLDRGLDEQDRDTKNRQQAEYHDVEAWLSQTGSLSGYSKERPRPAKPSGLRKTKARKERPSYINDWDEPRSYSPMEFRTPRAMTFEEIGALTATVST